MALHDGIPQLGCPGHGGVLGEIVLDRRDGRVLDVLRRGEVRLSRAEVDHIDALGRSLSASATTAMVAEGSMRLMRSVSLSAPGAAVTGLIVSCLRFIIIRCPASLVCRIEFLAQPCSTISGTSPFIGPPSCATSRTRRELR